MSDQNPTFLELAKSLKTIVQEHQVKIEELRAKELRKSAGGKLTKNELCALCGNVHSSCKCSLSKAIGGNCTSCGGALTGLLAADKTVCGACKARPPKKTKSSIEEMDDDRVETRAREAKKMGKSELCKSCSKTHMGKCDLSDVKPAKDVAKKELPAIKAAPEKKAAGAVLPKAGKKIEAGDGSGAVTKGKGLQKSAFSDALHTAAGAKPAGPAKGVVGVSGKQPVGQGGGDAHKVPQTAPTSVGQANKEIGGMKSIAGGGMPGAGSVKKLPMLPGRGPRAGNVQAPISGSFVTRKDEVPAQAAAGAADLQADKKAGGVGWLNALHAHVNRPKATKVAPDVMAVRDKMNMDNPVATPPAPVGAGPVRGGKPGSYAGVRGAAALARGEKKDTK